MHQRVWSAVLKYLSNVLAASALAFTSFAVQAAPVSGQGTWETTLQPRDINGDGVVDAYFNTERNLTWIADWGNASDWILVGPIESWTLFGLPGWRFPSALNSDGSGPCAGPNCNDSEIGQLWYQTLGNLSYDSENPDGTGLTNTGPFRNVLSFPPSFPPQISFYWLLENDFLTAWLFDVEYGFQAATIAQLQGGVFFVREGDVPEPESLILLSLGFVGLVLTRRRRR